MTKDIRRSWKKQRIAGIRAQENAEVVYNKPKATLPKFPTHHLDTRHLPNSGTAKFLYVLIPIELQKRKGDYRNK